MAPLSLTLERTFAVDRDTLWRLWTDEAHASRWMRPSLDEFGPTTATIDARVGGGFRFEFTDGAGSVSVVAGRFLEVQPPARLVYTWIWEGDPHESVVEVHFDEVSGGARVRLSHTRLATPDSVAAHEQGWIGCLGTLAATLAPRSSAHDRL